MRTIRTNTIFMSGVVKTSITVSAKSFILFGKIVLNVAENYISKRTPEYRFPLTMSLIKNTKDNRVNYKGFVVGAFKHFFTHHTELIIVQILIIIRVIFNVLNAF